MLHRRVTGDSISPMKIIGPLLLFCWLAAAQPAPPSVQTKGACSPVATGNNNTFSITCGIGKEQGQQMLGILNKILASQLDPNTVTAKLDEILAQLVASGRTPGYYVDSVVLGTPTSPMIWNGIELSGTVTPELVRGLNHEIHLPSNRGGGKPVLIKNPVLANGMPAAGARISFIVFQPDDGTTSEEIFFDLGYFGYGSFILPAPNTWSSITFTGRPDGRFAYDSSASGVPK